MNYIVMDLEFNQAYQFKDGGTTISDPLCQFEIIQMGAVKMDKYFEITDNINILIKPQVYKRMHPYVENLTGLTMEKLEDGILFPDAIKAFVDFIGRIRYTFCVWGSSDMVVLFNNMDYYGIDKQLLKNKYLNVQELTALYLKKPKKTCIGLKNATQLLGIDCQDSFHDARNDASYTAHIFKEVKRAQPVLHPQFLFN